MSARDRRTPVFKTTVLTTTPTPIEAETKLLSFWLQAPIANVGDVTLTDPDGGLFNLEPGLFTPVFEGVDLASIEVSGTVGDILQVVGYTPWN